MKENSPEPSNIRFKIQYQLLLIILPIAIIPLIVVVSFTFSSIFSHLENRERQFYSTLLGQVANNIDFVYKQYARTLSNIYNIPGVKNGLNAPPYKSKLEEDRIRREIIGEETVEGGLRNTAEEKIDGWVIIYEMDRKSIIYKTMKDHITHSVFIESSAKAVNYNKLIKDPLFVEARKNNKIKMIFGKLQSGVIGGYQADKLPAIIFPYYPVLTEKDSDTFTKFILILLNSDFVPNFYNDIESIQFGTLYILDRFDNIISRNHPGSDDYYHFDEESKKYTLEDDLRDDPFESLNFNDYQFLNTDIQIL